MHNGVCVNVSHERRRGLGRNRLALLGPAGRCDKEFNEMLNHSLNVTISGQLRPMPATAVTITTIAHDEWCGRFLNRECDCDPDIRNIPLEEMLQQYAIA